VALSDAAAKSFHFSRSRSQRAPSPPVKATASSLAAVHQDNLCLALSVGSAIAAPTMQGHADPAIADRQATIYGAINV
jgi:hypothetical protein